MQDHRYLRSFSQPLRAAATPRPATASRHYVHLERFARPGELLRRRGLAHHRPPARSGCSPPAPAGWRWRSRWPATAFDLPCPRVVGVSSPAACRHRVEAKDVDPGAAAPPRGARRRRARCSSSSATASPRSRSTERGHDLQHGRRDRRDGGGVPQRTSRRGSGSRAQRREDDFVAAGGRPRRGLRRARAHRPDHARTAGRPAVLARATSSRFAEVGGHRPSCRSASARRSTAPTRTWRRSPRCCADGRSTRTSR